jgi:hypothetical protein
MGISSGGLDFCRMTENGRTKGGCDGSYRRGVEVGLEEGHTPSVRATERGWQGHNSTAGGTAMAHWYGAAAKNRGYRWACPVHTMSAPN